MPWLFSPAKFGVVRFVYSPLQKCSFNHFLIIVNIKVNLIHLVSRTAIIYLQQRALFFYVLQHLQLVMVFVFFLRVATPHHLLNIIFGYFFILFLHLLNLLALFDFLCLRINIFCQVFEYLMHCSVVFECFLIES